jgi:phosphoketolase
MTDHTGKMGTLEERKAAERILNEFQETKIDKLHVMLINRLIPMAEATAIEMYPPEEFDKGFHSTMNRLTKSAGLRCR